MALMILRSDEARNHMNAILDEVTAGREVVIERYERPIGVIIPYDLWLENKKREAIDAAQQSIARINQGESRLIPGDEVMREVLAARARRLAIENVAYVD